MPDAAQMWAARLGDQDDDLSAVLRHVRVNRLPATRAAWANSWQTREFLNLGLLILHEHQLQQGTSAQGDGVKLSSTLTPENLANTAQLKVADPDRASVLSVVRWKETWGHQAAYTEDLIAYLFRPGPQERRIATVREAVLVTDPDLPYAKYVRLATDALFQAAAEDPVLRLQQWIQAAIPGHPSVLTHALRVDELSRELWTVILEKNMTAYGLTPKHGVTFADLAAAVRYAIAGLLLVREPGTLPPAMASGDSPLAAISLSLAAAYCDVTLDDLETRLPTI
ncbi:hypothetical protein ACIB24_20210 [Spongisporangium articulatum]|uniref:Uncharacterized protein n=1 Tax=Spongisporangium articulatum TaxID=3362603 RepID=A0ABW8ASM4_9ACTN